MNKNHLLYWIFHFLQHNNPDTLQEMITNFNEEKWSRTAIQTRKETLIETYEAWKQTQKNSN